MGRETEALRACPAAPNPFADIGLAAAGQVSPPCSSATSGHPHFLETCWQPISVPLWLSKGMLFPLLSISACCWGSEVWARALFSKERHRKVLFLSVCPSVCGNVLLLLLLEEEVKAVALLVSAGVSVSVP